MNWKRKQVDLLNSPKISNSLKTMVSSGLIVITSLIAAACAPQAAPVVVISAANGDAGRGQVLFSGSGACKSCHLVDSDVPLVGPALKGIGSIAATREAGVSAEQYLIESIVNPNKYLVENYPEGLMPQSYKDTLSSAEISDLVAYLLTLK